MPANVLRWLSKKYVKSRNVCLDGSEKEPSRQTSTKQNSGNGERSCKSNRMCENTLIQSGSYWTAIGTNVLTTCRVEGAGRMAHRLAISNRHPEETALQVRTKLVETKRKGCVDETVETKGTLERKTEIHWVKAHADTLKRKSTEDEKGNQTVDKLAEDAYHKLEHTPIGENGVIDQNTFNTVGAEVYIQGVRMIGNVG